MKFASIVFFGALLAYFVTDYLVYVVPRTAYQVGGAAKPEVQKFLEGLGELVDATGSPVAEKRFHPGYLRGIDVRPGFRVIHDPALGDEVTVTGPTAALEHLVLDENSESLSPDFDRPVRLRELVEVRVNLHEHGGEHLRVYLRYAPAERTVLQPDFVTEGPLRFSLLHFAKIPPHPVRVDSRDVVVYTTENTEQLEGTAAKLEFLFDDEKDPGQSAPALRAGEVLRTHVRNDD